MKQFVKKTILPVLALLFGELTTYAYEVVVDSIKYQVSDTYCIVSGYIKGINKAVIRDSVEAKSVTSIGNTAFHGCSSLTSIVIPDGVTRIGEWAFWDCSSLTSIVIPDGVTSIGERTFENCSSLTSIVLPDAVTSIGFRAFWYCTSLASIVIPDNVTSIANQTFWGCTSLTSIDIPDGVTSIGGSAFRDCSSLTSIDIPAGVTSIGEYTFYGCSSLTSIDIPDGVTSIGGSAFEGCTSLTSIDIPDCVTSIGESAFRGCSSLTSIVIPDGVTSIVYQAFEGCSSLASIVIPDGVTSIARRAFEGCSSLASIVIPDGVTSIEDYTFMSCSSLTSIVIPDGVTIIGESSFWGCSSLTSIVIPDGVTSIGNCAFYGCSSLTSIVIPDGVTSIEYYAFVACESLTSIVIPGVTCIDNAFGSSSLLYLSITGNEMADYCAYTNLLKKNNPLIFVDEGLYDIYTLDSDWAKYSANIISADMLKLKTVELTADEECSSLFTVLGDSTVYTANLKIKGSINGYDLMTLRNKTFHLLYLDLSEANIVANDGGYEYYTGFSLTDDNVLGNHCFSDLSLREVILPKSLLTIDNNAFSGCRFLEKVVLQDGLLSIGDDAFSGCLLKEIDLPGSLLEIGSGAFSNCNHFTGLLIIPDKVTIINSGAFYNIGVDSLIIGQNVHSIGASAFACCSNLKDIKFNHKIRSIGLSAFSGCNNLNAANLPYTVEMIDHYAFNNCISLESIKIPSMTKKIGDGAFAGCDNLRNVYTYTVEPTQINQHTFSTYKYATLNVPKTSTRLYSYNTQWSQFAFIHEFDEPYDAFYLNGDVELDEKTGRMSGEPDAEMYETSGFIIEGEETQELSGVELLHNGKDGASIIGSSNLAAKSMKVNITLEGNRWYFFCFPFNVAHDSIECTSDYVVYSYD